MSPDNKMKFELGAPKFYPAVVQWRDNVDVHEVRKSLLLKLKDLKVLIDKEFANEPDDEFPDVWPEVTWVNDRISNLIKYEGVDPNTQEAKVLIEEFYSIRAIHEELDQVCDKDSQEIIWELKWMAGNSLLEEKAT